MSRRYKPHRRATSRSLGVRDTRTGRSLGDEASSARTDLIVDLTSAQLHCRHGLNLQPEDDELLDFAPQAIEILNSTLRRDSKASPVDAAHPLDALYPDHLQGHDAGQWKSGGSFLWWFWDLFHNLARQVPHDSPANEYLAAAVQALKDLPTKTVEQLRRVPAVE
ncbi:hypothetical protein DL767_004599 [Monosporascus sp. MG133]|nr:hypothetical protein DL767_004599 [Monosporascus sp. MG133]